MIKIIIQHSNFNVKNLSIVLILNILIFFIYSNFQSKISINDNLGYDGVFYVELANQFKNNEKLETNAPFLYRIGTPFLASFFENIPQAFFYINIIFSILSSLLVFILLTQYLNYSYSIFLSILFQLHWVSGVRYILFDPIGVDYIALCFMFLGLILIKSSIKENLKIFYLIIISIFGVLFREIALIPSIVYLFINLRNDKKSLIPFFFGIFSYILILLFVEKTNDYNSLIAALKWFYIKGIGTFTLSLFNVFGLLVIIPFIFIKLTKEFILSNKIISIPFFIIIILGLIGGSDTERILSWSLPLFYILIFRIVEEKNLISNKYMIFILISLLLTYRVFWIIPDDVEIQNHIYPLVTFMSNDFNFADLFAYHGDKIFTSIQLVEYILLSIILFILFKRKLNGR